MKILHIISYPRSGSTILGLAFGQYSEGSYLGEVSALFTHTWDRVCGCSIHEPVNVFECPVWGPILEKSKTILINHNLWDSSNPGVTKKLRQDFLKIGVKNKDGEYFKVITEILTIVFNEASRLENAEIIVDSSKDLDYFRIIREYFNDQYTSLHLYRDSRGVVYSGRQNPAVPGKGTPLSLWRSSRIGFGWGIKNSIIKKEARKGNSENYELLYEEWCKNSREITDSILTKILKEDSLQSPFINDSTFNIQPCHSFFGNRSRKSSGSVNIKNDLGWRKGMDKRYIVTSTIFSSLFLKKFGYKILSRT